MKPKCIEAVSQALGRPLSQVEAQNIGEKINESMRQLGQRDPQKWQAMPLPTRLHEAARFAADKLAHDAQLKAERVAMQIRAHDANLSAMTELTAGGERPFEAVATLLDRVDGERKGVERTYFSRMMDTIESTNPKFFGMIEDAAGVRDLVVEIFGKDSGNQAAKKGAKAWLETVESMRQRFNRGGGDIGKLRYGYLPQPHDPASIRAATFEVWGQKVLPLLDRSRYVDEAGRRLDDEAMQEVLGMMYRTIASEGVNKIEPGEFRGRAMEAKAFSSHREIHFDGPEAYLSYMAEYGRGSVFDAMKHHVGRLARDIALVENLGPNAGGTVEFLRDHAKKLGDSDRVGAFMVSTEDMWTSLSGRASSTFDGGRFYQRLADLGQGVRNVEVFGKLQGALLSSVSDLPTYFLTSNFNRLPTWQAAINLVRAAGPETRAWANRAGLIAESVISDMNRWGENNIGQGWSGRLANATMKASLLSAWSDTLKRAFSITMMGGLGRLSRTEWGALAEADLSRMKAKGVTATDWGIWRLARLEDWRGEAMLTPEAIARIPDAALSNLEAGKTPTQLRDRATTRLLGLITDESEYAVTTPDLYTRAAVERGTQRGTIEGELLRSVMLFKSFPFAMISRHWERAFEQPATGRLAYGASLAVGLTIFGALAVQLKDLKEGKDPRDMTTPKFWGAAFSQGGGAGIFGDFLFTGAGGNGRAGLPNWMSLAGPVVGSGLELADLTLGNIAEAAKGKDTHAGAEAIRFARSHMPAVNLWYAKGAIDRAGLHDLQEMLSPGYLARMEERAARDWGQQYFWRPGQMEPTRAPDFEQVMGQ